MATAYRRQWQRHNKFILWTLPISLGEQALAFLGNVLADGVAADRQPRVLGLVLSALIACRAPGKVDVATPGHYWDERAEKREGAVSFCRSEQYREDTAATPETDDEARFGAYFAILFLRSPSTIFTSAEIRHTLRHRSARHQAPVAVALTLWPDVTQRPITSIAMPNHRFLGSSANK